MQEEKVKNNIVSNKRNYIYLVRRYTLKEVRYLHILAYGVYDDINKKSGGIIMNNNFCELNLEETLNIDGGKKTLAQHACEFGGGILGGIGGGLTGSVVSPILGTAVGTATGFMGGYKAGGDFYNACVGK